MAMIRTASFALLLCNAHGLNVAHSRRAALSRLATGTAGTAALSTGVLPPAALAVSKEEYKAKQAAKLAGPAPVDYGKVEILGTKPGTGLVVKGSMRQSGSSLASSDYVTAWVYLEYTGWLDKIGGSQQIDSSKELGGTGTVLYHAGVKATKGRAGTAKSGKFVPIPEGFDTPVFLATVGSTLQLKIPAELAFGAGGTTGTGATVPKGATVYYEVKIRSTTGDGGF